MTNAELIDALRCKAKSVPFECMNMECKYNVVGYCSRQAMENDAADALEAAEKRIAELMPKEGEWEHLDDADERTYAYVCSACHRFHVNEDEFYNYCPHCGARMGGETEHGNTYSLGKIEMPKGVMEQIIAAERKDDEQIH